MGLGYFIKTVIGTVFPRALLMRGRTRGPTIAITFDDGPHPEHTPQILNILDKANVRASFFLQGSLAAQYPKLIQNIHARGHLIGNHSFAHEGPETLGTEAYVDDVLQTHRLLQAIVQARLPKLFRPPFGAITPRVFLRLLWYRFRFIFWTRDSRDSFLRDHRELASYVESMAIRPGDVLLFHDDYAHTLAALPDILASLQQRGFQFVTVEHL